MKGLSLGNRCQGENRTKISIFSVKSQPNRYNFDFLDTRKIPIGSATGISSLLLRGRPRAEGAE